MSMMRNSLGSVLISLLLVGFVAAEEKAEESLYPLHLHSKWTYGVQGQKNDLVITTAKQEKVGETVCTVLESSMNGVTLASEHVVVSGNEVKRVRLKETDVVPPFLFARTSLKEGEGWRSQCSIVVHGKKEELDVQFRVDRQSIKVPAGEFVTYLVVGTWPRGETRVWLARGIGPVKMTFDFGEGNKTTLELKSADIKR